MSRAILDACVLVPPRLRDVLLSVAAEGVFHPLWSEEIQHEVRATTERIRPGQGVVIDRMFARMAAVFTDGVVHGWHARAVGLMTPDPHDRHVLAAAIAGNADMIITVNVNDFPVRCRPSGICVAHPDTVLGDMLSARPDDVLTAVGTVAERSHRPIQGILEDLGRAAHLAPDFAIAARKMIDDR